MPIGLDLNAIFAQKLGLISITSDWDDRRGVGWVEEEWTEKLPKEKSRKKIFQKKWWKLNRRERKRKNHVVKRATAACLSYQWRTLAAWLHIVVVNQERASFDTSFEQYSYNQHGGCFRTSDKNSICDNIWLFFIVKSLRYCTVNSAALIGFTTLDGRESKPSEPRVLGFQNLG